MTWLDDPTAVPPRCYLCRAADADGELDGEPRCIRCVDHELSLTEAIAARPELRETLPSVSDLRKMGPAFWPDWT